MFRLACLTLTFWAMAISAGHAARPVEIKIGDQAPPFSLVGSDGRTYRLADLIGKQVVVLAWFAKAFTSG